MDNALLVEVVHTFQNLVNNAFDTWYVKFHFLVIHQALQIVVQEIENQVETAH